jgi:hypothetical protein
VPSIYSVTPSDGLSRGKAVLLLDGWGYRMPEPRAAGESVPERLPTVAVYVNGERAPAVAVLSSTQVKAITPAYVAAAEALPALVDVMLQNLDDDGDPIPTEEVTAEDAFTYRWPNFAPDPATLDGIGSSDWLTLQLVETLRRGIVLNVGIGGSPDYSSAPATQVTYLSELPGISLVGPRFVPNPELASRTPEVASTAVGSTRVDPPEVEDLVYEVTLVGRSKPETEALRDEAQKYFRAEPVFTFPAGPSDATQLEADWIIEGEWTPADNEAAQTYTYTASLRVIGIELDDSSGVQPTGVPLDPFFADEISETDIETEELS